MWLSICTETFSCDLMLRELLLGELARACSTDGSGTTSLPMSCINAANRSRSMRGGQKFSSSPMYRA